MSKEEVFEVLKKNILEILDFLDPEEITVDKRLKDLGANSIDRVEIVTMTIEDLNIKLSPSELGAVNNLQSLVDLIYSKVG